MKHSQMFVSIEEQGKNYQNRIRYNGFLPLNQEAANGYQLLILEVLIKAD